MDLDQSVEAAMEDARKHVSLLKDAAESNIDKGFSGKVEEESAVRDLRGASNRFLNATKEEKLDKPKAYSKGKDPKIEDGWVTLRFRMTPEQRDIVTAAMRRCDEVKEVKAHVEKKKLWMGVALEWVAADFLATYGHPEYGDDDATHEYNAEEALKMIGGLMNRLLSQAGKLIEETGSEEIGGRFVDRLTGAIRKFSEDSEGG